MIRKAMIGAAVVLACASCEVDGIKSVETGNTGATAEVIAHVDGITVYRLWVGSRFIYFTDARGATSWDVARPKQSPEHNSVETVR